MSRAEYRIGYQIWKDDQPKGRVWWRICHTESQAQKFIDHLSRESERRKRDVALADVQVRDVGRWRSTKSETGVLPDKFLRR